VNARFELWLRTVDDDGTAKTRTADFAPKDMGLEQATHLFNEVVEYLSGNLNDKDDEVESEV